MCVWTHTHILSLFLSGSLSQCTYVYNEYIPHNNPKKWVILFDKWGNRCLETLSNVHENNDCGTTLLAFWAWPQEGLSKRFIHGGVGGGEEGEEARKTSATFCTGHHPGQVAGIVSMVTDRHPCHESSASSGPENLIWWFHSSCEVRTTQSCISSGHWLEKNTFSFSKSLLMILRSCLRNVLVLSDMLGEGVVFEIFHLLHSFQLRLKWKRAEKVENFLYPDGDVHLRFFCMWTSMSWGLPFNVHCSFDVRWWFRFKSLTLSDPDCFFWLFYYLIENFLVIFKYLLYKVGKCDVSTSWILWSQHTRSTIFRGKMHNYIQEAILLQST